MASLVLPPAAQSPHWSHINIFDFGRAMLTAQSAANMQWIASHLDVTESQGNYALLRSYNASLALSSYYIDMSIYQSQANALGLNNESWFLHFSDATTLEFWTLGHTPSGGGSLVGTASIPAGGRVQCYLWSDLRYIWNLNTASLRTWLKDRILASQDFYGRDVDSNAYIWMDEHAPGFQWPFSFYFQTVVTSGGHIAEYSNGTVDSIYDAYNTSVVNWLTYLKPFADAAGKKVLINANSQTLHPHIAAQIAAIRGFDTESHFRPDGFNSPSEFQSFATTVATSVANGGWVSLHGIWGYTGPANYTAGNYSSAAVRYNMWRLIAYYILKEPIGSSGTVFFNPAWASNDPPFNVALDIAAWLPAYQVNVGQPTASMTVYQTGSVGGQAYTIFGRTYTNGLMLLRTKDSSGSIGYDDTTIATVTFQYPVQVLLGDGTLAAPTTTVSIRNAEGVFVFLSTGAPAAPTGLRIS